MALLAATAFALIFGVMPSARVAWRPIWLGAGVAALAGLDDFKLDIVRAISDPFRRAADWGLHIEFPPD